MQEYILPILLTSFGSFFWLWSRGGKWHVARPREIDELEQVFHASIAAPVLHLVSVGLTIYGLYCAYKISWIFVPVTFFISPWVASFFWKLLNIQKHI